MVLTNEMFQVPTPFGNFTSGRKNSDEAEGIDLIEWQFCERGIREIWPDDRAHGIDDFTPADDLIANTRRDGIPVDERKRNTLVVDGDPRSVSRFRRTERDVTIHHLFLWRQTSGTRQFFIAVHPQAIAPFPRNERDGTHRLGQSADGYVATSREYARHSCQTSASFVGAHPRLRFAAPMAKTKSHCRNSVR